MYLALKGKSVSCDISETYCNEYCDQRHVVICTLLYWVESDILLCWPTHILYRRKGKGKVT